MEKFFLGPSKRDALVEEAVEVDVDALAGSDVDEDVFAVTVAEPEDVAHRAPRRARPLKSVRFFRE